MTEHWDQFLLPGTTPTNGDFERTRRGQKVVSVCPYCHVLATRASAVVVGWSALVSVSLFIRWFPSLVLVSLVGSPWCAKNKIWCRSWWTDCCWSWWWCCCCRRRCRLLMNFFLPLPYWFVPEKTKTQIFPCGREESLENGVCILKQTDDDQLFAALSISSFSQASPCLRTSSRRWLPTCSAGSRWICLDVEQEEPEFGIVQIHATQQMQSVVSPPFTY